MLALLLICVVAFLVLVWHSRLVGISLGLPIAYLFALLFQHLPGAFAHAVARDYFIDSSATEIGLRFTTIGTACFVTGVVLAQWFTRRSAGKPDTHWLDQSRIPRFAIYCVAGGWIVVYASAFFGQIPSISAAIDQAGSVWILGVLLGFLVSASRRRYRHMLLWLAALLVYPLRVLIFGGFLSFGSTSVFVVMFALVVSLRSQTRAYAGIMIFSVFCFLTFLSYFQNRDDIRESVWGGEVVKQRVARSSKIITDLKWFDFNDANQLAALDERLNQNKFAGMAAQNIASGKVGFLHGRSVWDGAQALVPRLVWPEKPIFAGSSQLIREMTDFEVNVDTTFGVGQVMEFYINFGIPALVLGFFLFGLAYGWIDMKTAAALQKGDFGQSIIWFLPAIGMLAPLASIAEIAGNVAAALVGGFGWRYVWGVLDAELPVKRSRRTRRAGSKKRSAETIPTETR